MNQEPNPEITKAQSIDNAQPRSINYVRKNKFATLVSKRSTGAFAISHSRVISKHQHKKGELLE
ncbi:hypothetical protein RINTHM_10710 [Richelia intracellularis HM01]|nr:hypothetical protein RINTHM_10710 [Richelia intracellularis HM01]